jgi:hypothetical protein
MVNNILSTDLEKKHKVQKDVFFCQIFHFRCFVAGAEEVKSRNLIEQEVIQ